LRFILANERSHLDFSILTNGRRFFDADHSDTLNQGGNLFSWLTDLTITNSRISNGIAIGFGGGFSILGGRADFENCTFDNNVSSTLGGAGNLDHNTESSFENCVFVQNQSEWGGGGINIYENSRVTIVKSSFVENEGAAGGGISLYGGNLLAEKCTFTRNRALMGELLIYVKTKITQTCFIVILLRTLQRVSLAEVQLCFVTALMLRRRIADLSRIMLNGVVEPFLLQGERMPSCITICI
jgi:hypothetical protein